MANLTIIEWNAIAGIVLTIITLIGIIASLYFSTKALREVQRDRRQRQCPHLAFDPGGFRFPVKFVKAGPCITGIDPEYAAKVFSNIPTESESVRVKENEGRDGRVKPLWIGRMKNYGLGPALATHVTWIPKEIWIGAEKFFINKEKLSEPLYSAVLNKMPAVPQHLLPANEAGLPRFPVFIEKDYEKKITRTNGILRIEYKDVFGTNMVTEQEFYLFTGYKEEEPWVHVTFSDIIS